MKILQQYHNTNITNIKTSHNQNKNILRLFT